MNERLLAPGRIAAAAATIGGVLLVALPEHAVSVVQLVLVTVAAAAGLYALIVNVSPAWWISPFDRAAGPKQDDGRSEEIDAIRSKLSGRRQPVENGPPVPTDVLRLLKPLIGTALEREGLDPRDERHREAARARVSPLTWAVLTSTPLAEPRWFRTRRPDERTSAEVVHRVLDDLDRLETGRDETHRPIDPSRPRAT